MSRDVPFIEDAICDVCGAKGAFDFMGDYACSKCSTKVADGLPFAISESVVEIGPMKLRCYLLSDGSTVFNAEDVHEFFGAMLPEDLKPARNDEGTTTISDGQIKSEKSK